MQELTGICKYCLYGCNKLEMPEFKGIHRCNNFIPDREDWYEEYRKELMKK